MRDGAFTGNPACLHVCSHILHTLWALVIQRGALDGAPTHSDTPMASLETLSSLSAANTIGSVSLGTPRQFLHSICPSIVSCLRVWLKQCVSYRFCLPALASLFCSSKQTFSIYRSVHLTKRNLLPWTVRLQ